MHCHLIVSRKDQSNKVKISPLTNHRNTRKGVIKGGFDRTSLFESAEKGFDRLFGYNRQLSETFEYCNTMKNGSIADQLKMQERELNSPQQSDKVINQAIDKSINQSFGLDNAVSLFSILPSSEDIDYNADVENERLLRKPKKKKQQRKGLSR